MTQLASDNFQRPDANPIGGNWTTLPNTNAVQLVSHEAEASVLAAENLIFYNSVVFPNDQYSEITIGNITGGYIHVGVRLGGSGNGYILLVESTSGNFYIQRLDGGSSNNLIGPVSSGGPFTSGEVIRLTVQGTTFTGSRNGTNAISVTDATYLSGSAGLGFFTFGSVAVATVSEWAGGNLITGFSISGNTGAADAVVNYSGTSSGTVTADGSGNYTIPTLADRHYTITPTLTNFIFSPASRNVTVSGSDVTGVNFTAAETHGWSPTDCRNFATFPNFPIVQNDGSVFWTGQVSCNESIPTPTSNPHLPPTDSRVLEPENSRVNPITVTPD